MPGPTLGRIFAFDLGLELGFPARVRHLRGRRRLGVIRVLVGEERELYRREARVRELNWVSVAPPAEPVRCRVKIRHKHESAPATGYPEGEAEARLVFEEPQRALTPGQAAVFYAAAEAAEPDLVLGGGWLR